MINGLLQMSQNFIDLILKNGGIFTNNDITSFIINTVSTFLSLFNFLYLFSSVYFVFAILIAIYEATKYNSMFDRVKVFLITIFESFKFLFKCASMLFSIISIPANLIIGLVRYFI